MLALVEGKPTPKLASALTSAIIRTSIYVLRCGSDGKASDGAAKMVGELVQDWLGVIEPCIRAQIIAVLNDGLDPHSAHGLVPGECVRRPNVAKHAGFNRKKPVSAMSTNSLLPAP